MIRRRKRFTIPVLTVILVILAFVAFYFAAFVVVDDTESVGTLAATSVKPAIPFKEDLQLFPTTTSTSTTTTTTIPPTTTTVPTTPVSAAAQPPRDGINWYAIAMCESSLGTGAPQWHINTGNGYYGGLQFSYSTWLSAGGGQYAERADLASPEQQIAIASTLPLSHWPICKKHAYD